MVHLFFPEIQSAPIFDIIRTLREVRCPNIKIWLPSSQKTLHRALLVATNLVPIEHDIQYNHNEHCFEWDFLKKGIQADYLPDEYYYWLFRRNLAPNNDSFAIVTDILPSKLSTKTIFTDGNDATKLPSDWYRFECLNTWDKVFDYCVQHGVIDCILLDPKKFEVVEGKNYKGAQIYKEKVTGYYWYKDTLHKNGSRHLEVFDSSRDHIGEADYLTGKIDRTKKEKGRTLDL